MSTVMVTGASRGIGRETVLRLAAQDSGFDRIVLLGRDPIRLETTYEELLVANPNKEYLKIIADLSDPNVVDQVFAQLSEHGVGLNTIVNNAGFTKPASVNETLLEDFETTIRVNLYSPFRIIQMALRLNHPVRQIINIASTAGMNGRAGWLSYSASKAAMINMSEVLRDELAPYNIDVTCLSPGRCATDLRRTLAPDEDPSTIMQPSQVAEIIKLMTTDTGMLLRSQNLVVRT